MLKPATPEAMQLLLQGSLAMASLEAAGVRIDMDYLQDAIKKTEQQILQMEKEQRAASEYKLWAKHYGDKMKIGSNVQLAKVVFDIMGFKRNPLIVDRKRPDKLSNDVNAFDHIDLLFVKQWFDLARMRKALSTYLRGLEKEVVDGFLHADFWLHTAESYRSSCRSPNLQNFPVRNKNISKIIRTAIIPRDGHILIEMDYGAQEVRVAQCYNQDPKLRDYILGGGDMHMDRALELYLLTEEELGSIASKTPGADVRYCAKNMFVFPQFYGSVYVQCAPNLWEAIGRMNLRRADGVSLYDHLKSKGIKKLGACNYELDPVPNTFEYVVCQAQKRMWGEVFTVYDQWKKDWWRLYQKQGGVNTLTGFKMEGVFKRNQILCDPIQGSAFHCELWSLIETLKELKRRKMKTKIILQIHDSWLADVPKSEVEEYMVIVQEIAVKRVAAHWKWITVPLKVEFEVSETNWFSKHKLEAA